IVKAHWAFFPRIGHWYRRRQEEKARIAQLRIGPPTQRGRYSGSVVWAYYAQGRQKFSELLPPKSRAQ
ncbi:MAG: hypothetical protein AAGJ82_11740, partial [Bacteroidota bacterium]